MLIIYRFGVVPFYLTFETENWMHGRMQKTFCCASFPLIPLGSSDGTTNAIYQKLFSRFGSSHGQKNERVPIMGFSPYRLAG
jgi:hypothetical protein